MNEKQIQEKLQALTKKAYDEEIKIFNKKLKEFGIIGEEEVVNEKFYNSDEYYYNWHDDGPYYVLLLTEISNGEQIKVEHPSREGLIKLRSFLRGIYEEE